MSIFAYIRSFIAAWRDYRLEPNTLLGQRYLIKAVIGEGSYGITYRGIDQTEDRPIVVKQARPSKGLLAQRLLEREAHILQSLSHPQLPAFIEWMWVGRRPNLVMSIVEGATLEELIFEQERRYGEVDSARITLQLLELVQYIHQQGIVHLDLRIPNVLLHEGQLSIIDFGLARSVGEPPFSLPALRSSRSNSELELNASRLVSPAEPQSDLIDVGHFMLFLLYSSFESPHAAMKAEEHSWQDELTLSPFLIEIIERLLQLREPYTDALAAIEALRAFVTQAVEQPVSFMSNNEYN